ncbi:MAG: glutamate-cysteine ligase family protein [Myxococcota bacterium]
MGTEIERTEFSEEDARHFGERLDACLALLRDTLAEPGFGEGERTVGAELELYLVDERGRPAPRNSEVLGALGDHRFTPELNRFNLEFNAPYTALAGRPFSVLEGHVARAFERLARLEDEVGARAVPIGILPTLERTDLDLRWLSNLRRYRVLNDVLCRLRGEHFHFQIDGADPLGFDSPDVTPEGAATSWQGHLRIDPKDFVDVYNAAQLTLPVVLALSSNSPLFLGHRLWHETRIALFKQAVDTRKRVPFQRRVGPARVAFGSRWLEGAFDALFADKVRDHAPLLPQCHRHPPTEDLEPGGAPRLFELRLHGSTVWLWNRPVYDPVGGGHVRLEQRALPAGPTARDMLASMAFSLGLIMSFRHDRLWKDIPFEAARSNFYLAAKIGIEAELAWPGAGGLEDVGVRALAERLLPRAREGLAEVGIEADEIDRYLAPILGRIETGQTGAVWQLRTYDALCTKYPRPDALPELVQRYRALAAAGTPVHGWTVSPP